MGVDAVLQFFLFGSNCCVNGGLRLGRVNPKPLHYLVICHSVNFVKRGELAILAGLEVFQRQSGNRRSRPTKSRGTLVIWVIRVNKNDVAVLVVELLPFNVFRRVWLRSNVILYDIT